jgi:demethylmenaquinone methyltransferase/2-methoxy-6-polyprenyl-1,4-benzoquinol methylase
MLALPSQSDKPRFVAAMFGRIAERYDVMNTLMTAGQDGAWRRSLARSLGAPRGVLDVGTGTARLAAAVAAQHPYASVVGVDFAEPMLRARQSGVAVAAADALRLPFADGTFDAVVSAFVVRNLADLGVGLAEQARVLRPGGCLAILETTPGPSGILRPLFRLYFQRVVPLLGRLIAGDAAAYTYLPTSSAAFLEPSELANFLRARGFADIAVRRLALGSVALITARRG